MLTSSTAGIGAFRARCRQRNDRREVPPKRFETFCMSSSMDSGTRSSIDATLHITGADRTARQKAHYARCLVVGGMRAATGGKTDSGIAGCAGRTHPTYEPAAAAIPALSRCVEKLTSAHCWTPLKPTEIIGRAPDACQRAPARGLCHQPLHDLKQHLSSQA